MIQERRDSSVYNLPRKAREDETQNIVGALA